MQQTPGVLAEVALVWELRVLNEYLVLDDETAITVPGRRARLGGSRIERGRLGPVADLGPALCRGDGAREPPGDQPVM